MTLRRKCTENFKLEGCQLYYRKGTRGMKSDVSKEGKDISWRLCIRTNEEKRKVLKSCHEAATGMCLASSPGS